MVGNMTGKQTDVLHGEAITRTFGKQKALAGVNVGVGVGQCLAIIGGSGSGKSTLLRILLGLDSPTGGNVVYRGLSVAGPRSAGYRALRRESGLVFQSPLAALDPRWTVGRSVAEPLVIDSKRAGSLHSDSDEIDRDKGYGRMTAFGRRLGLGRRRGLTDDDLRDRVAEALALTGLDPDEFINRYPADLSGGQAQRVVIARAVVAKPSIIVADEPMSAIDVAARLQILEAFAAIRAARPRTALILVSHDLGVVQHIADRILVLHDGVVEQDGPTSEVLGHPASEYAKRLVDAAKL
jgi:peptide/nickel transport system ATP-binding protein